MDAAEVPASEGLGWDWLDIWRACMTLLLVAVNVYIGLMAKSTASRQAADALQVAEDDALQVAEDDAATVLVVIG